MRNYWDRFKRGYAWEVKDGATNPLGRLAFSVLFSAFLFIMASDTLGYIFSSVVALGLAVTWVVVTAGEPD